MSGLQEDNCRGYCRWKSHLSLDVGRDGFVAILLFRAFEEILGGGRVTIVSWNYFECCM